MNLRRLLPPISTVLALTATTQRCRAQGCGDDGGNQVLLTAGLGLGAGASGALGTSAILAAADSSSDFKFGVGAGVGVGVTAALSAVYLAVDGSTGCRMVQRSGSIAWSVPISMLVIGTLLPLAIWGATRSAEPSANATPQSSAAAAAGVAPAAGLTLHF